MLPAHKHVALRRRRGAKLVDPVETSHDRHDYIPSPEVSKVQEALEASSFELHAVVKDPFPDALRLAESLKVSTSGENEAHDAVVGNHTNANDKDPNSSHDRKGKALEADRDDGIIKDQNRRIKSSLFERNHTAHTTEWSDSIDSYEEGSPTRPHLPTPQKRKVSPLSVYKMEKLIRQRKKKRWSILEEDTLRTGVQKYGRGNWKLILSMYRDIFEDRTEDILIWKDTVQSSYILMVEIGTSSSLKRAATTDWRAATAGGGRRREDGIDQKRCGWEFGRDADEET
ncbi:hypothetical protein E3N88_11193 [Mikania micrantha]|uniref:Myb-like domain-containing protein n=1 Tax=Mikania micrantha TaxID=192012 RepID=A0A5N6PEN5_9ASTR|nr:hypothetical protein E3N88_11193 [Mikania micrantha]